MGDYQGEGVRRPQKAGTRHMAKVGRRPKALPMMRDDDRRCTKGGRRCSKVGQKIGLESLLDYSEGGGKAVNKGVSKVPKVKR